MKNRVCLLAALLLALFCLDTCLFHGVTQLLLLLFRLCLDKV